MPIEIDFRITGPDLARCTVQVDGARAELRASDISDALGLLVEAARRVLSGSRLEQVSFDDEPGEYRWTFEQRERGQLALRIVTFDGARQLPDGSVLLEGACSARELAEAVVRALERVRDTHGEPGYRRLCGFPFPLAALAAMKAALGQGAARPALGRKP